MRNALAVGSNGHNGQVRARVTAGEGLSARGSAGTLHRPEPRSLAFGQNLCNSCQRVVPIEQLISVTGSIAGNCGVTRSNP